jgi:hypothetical protein
MMQPFDHPRADWYPPGYGGPGQVQGSDGQPRPPLAVPLDTFGVHYGGAGASWLDKGDTAAELRGIELNHARPQGKPNEYNSASDSASETWEYAGRFRAAHSSGNNSTVWGHLVVYGLEQLSEVDAQALIRGIRRARAQCVTAGYLTAGHRVLPHSGLPGASTSCPGPLHTNARWWAQVIAPLTPADFDIVTPNPPVDPIVPVPPVTGASPEGGSVFHALIRLEGQTAVFAQYTGGYKVWIKDEATLGAFRFVSGKDVQVIPKSAVALFRATGPIFGPMPTDSRGVPLNVDAYGVPK